MSTSPGPFGEERHTFGWALGTVRGLMSLLIVSFFWIVFLMPDGRFTFPAPLGHFFLISLVLMALVTHPHQKIAVFPQLLRWAFIGGTLAVVIYLLVTDPTRLAERFTPSTAEVSQWPALAGTMFIAFGIGHFMRVLLGHTNEFFQTARAWIGVIALVLLAGETLFQFVIRPTLGEPPAPASLEVWECILVGAVAGYFGTRM